MPIKISVIIPSLNSKTVDKTIASLKKQAYGLDEVEIIVVGLDKHGLVRQDEHVRFVSTQQPVNAAVARNIGIEHSQGELLLFTDADCIAARDWVEKLVERHGGDVDVVGGAVDFPADNYWVLSDNISCFHEYLPTAKRGVRKYLPSCNLCLPKEVALEVGGFDGSMPRSHDMDFTVRLYSLGYKLYFEPKALIYHCPPERGFGATVRRLSTSGENSIKVRLKHAGVYETPFFMKNPFLLLVLSPLVSGYITLKIFALNSMLLKYWYAMPIVFLSKIAWCLGAVKGLLEIGKAKPM